MIAAFLSPPVTVVVVFEKKSGLHKLPLSTDVRNKRLQIAGQHGKGEHQSTLYCTSISEIIEFTIQCRITE
jgi:hypothetical protein